MSDIGLEDSFDGIEGKGEDLKGTSNQIMGEVVSSSAVEERMDSRTYEMEGIQKNASEGTSEEAPIGELFPVGCSDVIKGHYVEESPNMNLFFRTP